MGGAGASAPTSQSVISPGRQQQSALGAWQGVVSVLPPLV